MIAQFHSPAQKAGSLIKFFLKASGVFTFLFLISSAPICAQDYKTKTFKVNRNGHILVDNKYGDIVIRTWNKNEVAVKYSSDFDDDKDSDNMSIKAAGNHVRVRSYSSDYTDFEIIIPTHFYIEMKTQAGDLKVYGSFTGSLEGTTSGGDVLIDKVSGFVNLLTYGGDIKADDVKGEIRIASYGGDLQLSNIDGNGSIQTSGGNIKIKNISSTVKVSTGGGNISVDNINGNTRLNTGGGNISIKSITGNAVLNSTGGNIKSLYSKGDISAATGSGNIYLYKLDGSVKAVTGSGDVLVELINDNSDKTNIRTANGKIKLYIPDDAKLTIDVRIRSMGKHYSYEERDFITTDLKPTGKNVNKNSNNITATYSFNGGGKKVYLDTSNGEIEIKRLSK